MQMHVSLVVPAPGSACGWCTWERAEARSLQCAPKDVQVLPRLEMALLKPAWGRAECKALVMHPAVHRIFGYCQDHSALLLP